MSTQELVGADRTSGLSFDETGRSVCLMILRPKLFGGYSVEGSRDFKHFDVISAEIVEDGETITTTMRTSQIGGALVGGALLGGVGALVGALTGKTSAKNKVRSLDLKITVNDLRRPIHTVKFIESPCMRGDMEYQRAAQKANHWLGVMSVLIKQADEETRGRSVAAPIPTFAVPVQTIEQENPAVPVSNLLVADELAKLDRLVEMDVLTKEEFIEQKRKLLEQGTPALSASQGSAQAPDAVKRYRTNVLGLDDSGKPKVNKVEALKEEIGLLKRVEALTKAIDSGNLSEVETLLKSGGENWKNVIGEQLHHVMHEPYYDQTEGCRLEMVKLFIEHGVDLSVPSGNGPILHAALTMMSGDEQYEVVRLLVDHGADVNLEWNGECPLNLVSGVYKVEERMRLRDFLIARGAIESRAIEEKSHSVSPPVIRPFVL